jgi:hypothetical protein
MTQPTRSLPVRVDLRLTEAERDYLTSEAQKRGISRQDMLRQLVLTPEGQASSLPSYKPVVVSQGRDAIDRAIDAVTRQYHCIPRHQLEPIVCTVICALTAEG